MAWLAQWWSFLVTIAVVFVPGLVAAWSLGLRRLGAIAFAPVASAAMVSFLAIVFGFAHIPWNGWSAIIGLALVAAALVGCRFLFRIPATPDRGTGARWPLIAALVAGGALIAVRLLVYIGDPTSISQTNDAAFHLGAVRAIIEHSDASSFGLAHLVDPEAAPSGFYPGAWHALVSLITLANGGDIAVATNALTLVVATVVWPLGIAWLTLIVTGRRLAAAAAVLIAPVIVIFPLEMMQYGALYPYFLAVALVPASIAVIVALTRRPAPAPDGTVAALGRGRVIAAVIAFLLGGAAIGTAQTSAVLAWCLALWIFAAAGAILLWRRRGPRRGWAVGAVVVALGLLGVVWWRLGTLVTADVWSARRNGLDAAKQILSNGFIETPPIWWLTALVVVGLYAVLRRRGTRWLAVVWLTFVFLAFTAYGVRNPDFRVLVVGPWYSDPYRLSALVPVIMLPVAAAGVVLIVDAIASLAARRDKSGTDRVRTIAGPIALGVLLAIGIGTVAAQPLVLRYKLGNGSVEEQSSFLVSRKSLLTADKLALFSRLADEVSPHDRILANPRAGGDFGYYLTGLDIYPAKYQLPVSEDYRLLMSQLQRAASDPQVCDAVRALRAKYVLDLGTDPAIPLDDVSMLPGFTGFESVPGFELVDRQGAASLWRITACGT